MTPSPRTRRRLLTSDLVAGERNGALLEGDSHEPSLKLESRTAHEWRDRAARRDGKQELATACLRGGQGCAKPQPSLPPFRRRDLHARTGRKGDVARVLIGEEHLHRVCLLY